MFENFINIFKKNKKNKSLSTCSKNTAKERLHLVLMQDRANVSADFLDLMRKEIIEVIKKYIDIDEKAMDVRLTTETNEDGTQGIPALYANIPIINIKDETRQSSKINQEKKIIECEPPKSEEIEINNENDNIEKNEEEHSKEQMNPKEETKEDTKKDDNSNEEIKNEKEEKQKENHKEDKSLPSNQKNRIKNKKKDIEDKK